jgi:hypothetical protein
LLAKYAVDASVNGKVVIFTSYPKEMTQRLKSFGSDFMSRIVMSQRRSKVSEMVREMKEDFSDVKEIFIDMEGALRIDQEALLEGYAFGSGVNITMARQTVRKLQDKNMVEVFDILTPDQKVSEPTLSLTKESILAMMEKAKYILSGDEIEMILNWAQVAEVEIQLTDTEHEFVKRLKLVDR